MIGKKRNNYSKYGAAARGFRQASEIEEPLEPRTNNCLALGAPDRKVTGFDDMTQYALDMLSLYQLSHGGMSGRSNGSGNINIAVRWSDESSSGSECEDTFRLHILSRNPHNSSSS